MDIRELTRRIEAGHTSKLVVLHEGDPYPDNSKALVLTKMDSGAWKAEVGGRRMNVTDKQLIELLVCVLAQE